MATGWTARKSGSQYANVPLANLDQLLENMVHQQDAPGWLNAAKFPYPRHGGAGALWHKAFQDLAPEKTRLNTSLIGIDSVQKLAHLSTGQTVQYQRLITSAPLPKLIDKVDPEFRKIFPNSALKYSSSHVLGVGVQGRLPDLLKNKCWIHVASPDIVFFRVTVLSNYSEFNVPKTGEHWSVMCEVSSSVTHPVDAATVQTQVDEGLRSMGLLGPGDEIVSRWHRHIEHGYPIPCLERDAFLATADKLLTQRGIYSRGRFGAWKYEVSNQDNAFMQGVEAVDRFVMGTEELTYRYPAIACEDAVDRILPTAEKEGQL
jgi:protoporphyrinogen oxidase